VYEDRSRAAAKAQSSIKNEMFKSYKLSLPFILAASLHAEPCLKLRLYRRRLPIRFYPFR